MSDTPPGRVRVADDVIASIAATAAAEVDGVAGVDASHRAGRVLPGRPHAGVRVEVTGEDRLRLELSLRVEEGTAIPPAATEVQSRVAEALKRMLGLEVDAVDVVVSDVVFRQTG
jgi:uncharacterized alkaline shock family protein YloU